LNACCHIGSGHRRINAATVTFLVIHGKGSAMHIQGVTHGCDYEGEIAVIYGKNRVYVGRHLLRALDAARRHFARELGNA
jgi:2-keto-4-pentenoate hydratase/2-oxohepta-3-ene-1,7-dioic acid hydratase in catechol pathway